MDIPATAAQKAALKQRSTEMVKATELAGEPIIARLPRAPGNDAPIGGLKFVTENGWFAARPSGTEDIAKLYAETFLGGRTPCPNPVRTPGHYSGCLSGDQTLEETYHWVSTLEEVCDIIFEHTLLGESLIEYCKHGESYKKW